MVKRNTNRLNESGFEYVYKDGKKLPLYVEYNIPFDTFDLNALGKKMVRTYEMYQRNGFDVVELTGIDIERMTFSVYCEVIDYDE